jgi:hypothetical protein
MQLVLGRCTIRPWRLDDAVSKIFRSDESLRRSLRTIQHPHTCLKKPGSLSKGCLKNDVLKDGKLLDSLLYARTT